MLPRTQRVAAEERPGYDGQKPPVRDRAGGADAPEARTVYASGRWVTGAPNEVEVPTGLDAAHLAPTRSRDGATPTAAEALDALAAAVSAVQRIDWDAEDAATLADAPVVLQRQVNRLAAGQVRCIGAVDGRGVYGVDGAVSHAAWLANRTGIEHATASRLVSAARRLSFLPKLADTFAAGDTSVDHVTAVTSAATPTRQAAFAAADATFAELAAQDRPSHVRLTARFLADQVDPDGSKPKPEEADVSGKDVRRGLTRWQTLDGLTDWRLLEDPLDAELTSAILDAFDEPDPPDTPEDLRRSPAQRRADAHAKAMQAAAASIDAPTVHGAKPHALAMFDLARFLGRPDLATFTDQLRYGGQINLDLLARLLDNAMVTIVLTLGPWRVVNVGRTHRTLPAVLRPAWQMIHRRCRGPDCDRPVTWTQAHHETAWEHGGQTDLNHSIPLCQAHHTLVTSCGWTVHLEHDTGETIWTTPDGNTITVPAA